MNMIKQLIRKVTSTRLGNAFTDSSSYWDKRYRSGRDSGEGSYGKFARFKAEVLNEFVQKNLISSIVEFGCGDGNQLLLAKYPSYHGVDVSKKAVEKCRSLFMDDETKTFELLTERQSANAELALSLDVVYHLVEEDVYENYMTSLFDAASKFVIVYSSNSNKNISNPAAHVRHRQFTDWVTSNRPDWDLTKVIPNRYPFVNHDDINGSFADFYFFQRTGMTST